MGKKKTSEWYRLGKAWRGSSSVKKKLGHWQAGSLSISHLCALAIMRIYNILGGVNRVTDRKWRKGLFPLLCACYTISGVLHSILGSSVQEKHCEAGGHKKRWWAGAFPLWEEAVGPRLVQPGAETVLGTPNSSPGINWEVIKYTESGSSQQCMVWHRNSSHKQKWEVQIRYKEKNFTLRITEYWSLSSREAEASLFLETSFDLHWFFNSVKV